RTAADQLERIGAALFEIADLALERRRLERPLNHQHEAIGLERLLDIVVGTALDRRNCGLDVAVAGNDDDRQIWILFLDDIKQGEAVKPAALKPDVEHDQRWAPLL